MAELLPETYGPLFPLKEEYVTDPRVNKVFDEFSLLMTRDTLLFAPGEIPTELPDDDSFVRGNDPAVQLSLFAMGTLQADSPAIQLSYGGRTIFNTKGANVTELNDVEWPALSPTRRTVQWIDNDTSAVLTITLRKAEWDVLASEAITELVGAELISECVELRAPRVSQVAVVDTSSVTPNITVFPSGINWDGDLRVYPGYNIELTEGDSIFTPDATVYKPIEMTVNAVAGAGEGLAPSTCTEADLNIRSINGVVSNANGDFNLGFDDCYRWLPYQDTPQAPTLKGIQLQGDCTSCSACDDFLTVYSRLRAIYDRMVGLDTRITSLVAQYDWFVKPDDPNKGVVVKLQDKLDLNIGTMTSEKLGDDSFSLQFRFQAGVGDTERGYTNVELTWSFSNFGSVTNGPFAGAPYVAYSGRAKAPGLAPIVDDFSNSPKTHNFSTSPGGTVGPYQFAYWSFAILADPAGMVGSFDVDWIVKATPAETPSTQVTLGSGTVTLTLGPPA